MIPVTQTKLHIPDKQNGNCMAAAFASILEMRIEDVPCFEDMPAHGEGTSKKASWWNTLNTWLLSLGFLLIEPPKTFPGYFIANGLSPRGFEHSVIYKGTKLVHDPHPSNDGISEITSAWALLPLDPHAPLEPAVENIKRKDPAKG